MVDVKKENILGLNHFFPAHARHVTLFRENIYSYSEIYFFPVDIFHFLKSFVLKQFIIL